MFFRWWTELSSLTVTSPSEPIGPLPSTCAAFLQKQKLNEMDGLQFLQKIGVESLDSLSKEQMKAIMKKYDVNGDGRVDKAEFKKFLKDLFTLTGQESLGEEELELLYKDVDKDGSGFVDAGEFLAMFDPPAEENNAGEEFLRKLGVEDLSKSQIAEVMEKFDVNGDGHIDKAEFKKFLVALFAITRNQQLSEEEIELLYQDSDKDGSGYVDKTEFLAMFD